MVGIAFKKCINHSFLRKTDDIFGQRSHADDKGLFWIILKICDNLTSLDFRMDNSPNCSRTNMGQYKTWKWIFHLFQRYLGIKHIPKVTSKWTYIFLNILKNLHFSFLNPTMILSIELADLDGSSQDGSRTTNYSWKQNQKIYCEDYVKFKKQLSIKTHLWWIESLCCSLSDLFLIFRSSYLVLFLSSNVYNKGFSFNCLITVLVKFQKHSLLQIFLLTDMPLKLSFIGI